MWKWIVELIQHRVSTSQVEIEDIASQHYNRNVPLSSPSLSVSVSLSLSLSVCLSVSLSLSVSVSLSLSLSVCLSLSLSLHLPLCLFIFLSLYLLFHLSFLYLSNSLISSQFPLSRKMLNKDQGTLKCLS